MKFFFLCLLITTVYEINAQTTENELNKIIEELTVEEKAYLLVGAGMNVPGLAESTDAPQAIVGTTKDKVPGAAGTSHKNVKFGIPTVVFADGPAGIRIDPTREVFPEKTFYATAFPTATSLASTWNTDLVKQVGQAFGREGKEYGVDFLLAPALNIHRNPLGGRNFEYYSEDPVVSGKIAAAFVNGVQEEGIGATIKHFVANNSETNRTELNTVVSERALREIYLKGFQIAIRESQPWSVMSSYNKINGVYASENEELLTKILRDEWHFDGFVITDWFGGKDAISQMKAGNDLIMPGTNKSIKAIIDAVESGKLEISILNRNVKYILTQYAKTPSFNNYNPSDKPDLEANKIIARKAASEGMVLLKNKNTLPLNTSAKVALFGVTSFETISGGTGSGDVNKAYMVSVTEGFQNAGYKLDEEIVSAYNTYIKEEKAKIPPKKMFFEKDILVPEKLWSKDELKEIAKRNDVAVFTIGRTSGEFQDREIENDFNLTTNELQLLKNLNEVFHANGKALVVVLNIGSVIETQNWKDYADAILLSWQPGQEAGNAITDLLSGKTNPSGKLTTTFPISINDIASSKNFPGKVIDPSAKKPDNPLFGIPSEEVYEEGIYVGYRFFDSFHIESSYPFGFGLSYTNFQYSELVLTKEEESLQISFVIKNIGDKAGKEVAQLYVKSATGTIDKPQKELKGFAKTKLLNPGESQQITLRVNIKDLGYYDTSRHSWVLDQGDYQFVVSSDSKTAELIQALYFDGTTLETLSNLLSPVNEINELSRP